MKNNRIILLVFALFLINTGINAQAWKNLITEENPTFYDIQDAFNEYWKDYNVVNGKYLKDGKEQKAVGWKQFKRWEWYWETRVGQDGQFPPNTVNYDEWVKTKSPNYQTRSINTIDWTSIGNSQAISHTHGLGRVNCLGFHPTNANIFWAGTPAGGLWKTTDGGQSWNTGWDNMPVLGVSSIVIHPTNPDIMYVATGDGDIGSLYVNNVFGVNLIGDTKSIGILKSIDGGVNWTVVLSAQQEQGIQIRKIIIDPDYPSYLYAATTVGLYMTSDNGDNWSLVQSGWFMDIEFNPTNTMVMYATTFSSSGNAKIYTSTDGGVNWTATLTLPNVNRIELAVTPNATNNVDALCSRADNNGLYGLYYSSDQGANWSQYFVGASGSNLLGWFDNASDENGQGLYDLSFTIDPDNYNNMVVGGVNTWRTTNGGTGWGVSNFFTPSLPYNTNEYNYPLIHADKHFLTYHPLNSGILFECNDGGIAKSTDNGLSWTDISNGIINSQMYSISSSEHDNTQVVCGLQDNGTQLTDQSTWVGLTGGDGMMCHFDNENENLLYTSYINGKIYRLDAVNGVSVISQNLPGGQKEGVWLTPYQLDPNDNQRIYACYNEVYTSPDRGDN